MKVLVVEDEPPISAIITAGLAKEGYDTLVARDGEQGLQLYQQHNPDAIVLDVGLPKLNGLDVCDRIRRSPPSGFVPYILILSARTDEADCLLGLSYGADAYLRKPFSVRELIGYLRAHVRRGLLERSHPQPAETIETPHFIIQKSTREIWMQQPDGLHEIENMGAIEFDLFCLMASSPRRVWSRAQLLDAARGHDYRGDERSIDTCIRRVRDRITPPGGNREQFVKTCVGIGYKFEDEPNAAS